ncbi:MAG: adenosylcobinamide amidohydrolase [Gaiellaceae bacterium]
MRPRLLGPALAVELDSPYRALSSAVLGGGLSSLRTWLNLQVPPDYARTDPAQHLHAEAAGLEAPVVGMLTAVDVRRHTHASAGGTEAIATVGIRHALAAAGQRPRALPPVGTINLLVVVGEPLADAALVGALQTAVEAKAQALAAAGVRAANAPAFATGTATDAICLACPPGEGLPFAGPATRIGGEIARAVHRAVLEGALIDLAHQRERRTAWSSSNA